MPLEGAGSAVGASVRRRFAQLLAVDIAAAMAAQMRNSTGHGHWDGMKRWIEAIEPDFMN